MCAKLCFLCATLRKVRSQPIENILNEVKVNVDQGNRGIILHGEDIFLYQSDGLKVNAPAGIDLFEKVYHTPGMKWVSGSHASLASALSDPDMVRGVSEVLELGTDKHPTKA